MNAQRDAGPKGRTWVRRWVDALRRRWATGAAAWERRRRLRRQIRALEGLDARELKDIGLGPGEIPSLAAELVGCASGTRRRIRTGAH
ncbi:MAG TPA: DUF1127 domain-containing protein [Burkholderiales bacterium]|nr:DUF1127 domain-containing protein [Burkholderiales bacterium]